MRAPGRRANLLRRAESHIQGPSCAAYRHRHRPHRHRTPAAAQRLDSRRSSGGIDEGRAYCRFTAYPNLKLEHCVDGSDAMGTWDVKARETTPSWDIYAYLIMLFPRRPDTGAAVPIAPVFGVDTQHEAFPARSHPHGRWWMASTPGFFRWDVHPLREAPIVLAQADWNAATPSTDSYAAA